MPWIPRSQGFEQSDDSWLEGTFEFFRLVAKQERKGYVVKKTIGFEEDDSTPTGVPLHHRFNLGAIAASAKELAEAEGDEEDEVAEEVEAEALGEI